MKIKAYYGDGTSFSSAYANQSHDKIYSINTSWSVVSAWLLAVGQSSQVIAWDVSFEDTSGVQMIAAQRYQLRNRGEEENGFIWSNTLGGIDTVSLSGSSEEDKKLTTGKVKFYLVNDKFDSWLKSSAEISRGFFCFILRTLHLKKIKYSSMT